MTMTPPPDTRLPVPDTPGPRDDQHPYLILTLRRTGGTSLMAFLSRVSAFPSIQHEPFNPDRVWGGLRVGFEGRYDTPDFAAALAGHLAEHPNIKHCIELVAPDLTAALIDACAARGYRLFLLLRHQETARLRSLCLAQLTGAWGRQQVARIYPQILSGAMPLSPVDIAALNRHARRDAQALATVRAMLETANRSYQTLFFEEIYARDGLLPNRACALAAQLGVTVAPDDPRLEVLTKPPGIPASRILPFVPNADALEVALKRIDAPEQRGAVLKPRPAP